MVVAVLRWHRDLLARHHATRSRPKHPGRPRTIQSIRALVLRLSREKPHWGYRRVHGELLVLGVTVAAFTVWEILNDAGINPAPERGRTAWAQFLRSQAEALLACDFFETRTLNGTRLYVFAVIEHATRRIRVPGATAHPTTAPVTQAAKEPRHRPRRRPLPSQIHDPRQAIGSRFNLFRIWSAVSEAIRSCSRRDFHCSMPRRSCDCFLDTRYGTTTVTTRSTIVTTKVG
jgi:hypothetical protein